MKINANDIASTLVELGIPFEAQGRYLQVAIARVIGYLLPIPAEAVTSTPAYFEEHLASKVAGALDAITERIPVDYEATLALTRKVWEVRYGLVHPQTDAQAWALLDACVKKAHICEDIDFSDAALQRLGSALTASLEQ